VNITDREIALWRLHTQRLVGVPCDRPADVVRHLLGVQAENYSQATWAIAARCAPTTSTEIDQLYSSGAILRTHVLRTTWHFVDPVDIAWLCALTGPRLRMRHATQQRQLGIDDQVLSGAVQTVVSSLEADGALTRNQLRSRLDATGAPTAGAALTLITATAEAEGLVCSGPLVDGEHTHDLISRRAPRARRLDRDEALAELAWRYVTGHGPITEADLSYWATLTLADARAGLAAAGDRLASFDHDGRRFWYEAGTEPDTRGPDSAHVLQILDEIYRGYQDSRWVLDADELLGRGREPSTGMALINGQIAGTMTRSVSPDALAVLIAPYRNLTAHEEQLLRNVARRCGRFLDRKATLHLD
jgi:hypothetical protein